MTSFYVPLTGATAERLRAVEAQIRYAGNQTIIRAEEPGFLWVGDAAEQFGPAWDETTGVWLVTAGRLVWSQSEWAKADTLPYRGGRANRLLLQRYLERGPAAVVPYNGAVCALVCDPRDGLVHLWTDQFGYHPCFVYRGDDRERCIVSTFPDALLSDPAAATSFDPTSMAEFIRAWRVTPPNTYFREVKHAGAATYRCWRRGVAQAEVRAYWNPLDSEFFPDIKTAAAELADAVSQAIHERTAVAKRPVFFVSGGTDSRVLLFAAADRSRAVGIHLYERPMVEAATTVRLCDLAGVKYVGVQRDNDFYPRMLRENVRWSGAMWSTEDSHYLGFREHVDRQQPDLVMTACTTDWVFKGYGLEKAYRRLFGRDIPFYRYIDERVDGFLPNVPLPAPAEYKERVDERMGAWFAGCPTRLNNERDRLMVEDRRVRPSCYAVSVSGQMMYRVFPYDTFLADSRVAACYCRIPPKWKLNSEVWGLAAARICAGAGDVINANFGWRVDAGPAERAFSFAKSWVWRRIRPAPRALVSGDDGRPPSTGGSWPDMGWYAVHSRTLREFWNAVPPQDRDMMSSVCGLDPWKQPLETWSADGSYLFRMLTLLAHWQTLRERVQAADATVRA